MRASGPAFRFLAQDADQQGPGVRDRRVHLGGTTFDALIFGYYENDKLIYVVRTRNGFTPKVRADLMKRFGKLRTDKCPFANLPEPRTGSGEQD
ncbi:MAG: hypothetical protein ACJ746_13675 [Bryobacteraceae bacterium]